MPLNERCTCSACSGCVPGCVHREATYLGGIEGHIHREATYPGGIEGYIQQGAPYPHPGIYHHLGIPPPGYIPPPWVSPPWVYRHLSHTWVYRHLTHPGYTRFPNTLGYTRLPNTLGYTRLLPTMVGYPVPSLPWGGEKRLKGGSGPREGPSSLPDYHPFHCWMEKPRPLSQPESQESLKPSKDTRMVNGFERFDKTDGFEKREN